MKRDTKDSATRSVPFSQIKSIPSVLIQTNVPRTVAVLMKKQMKGSVIQNAGEITRVLDPIAGAPVVTSVVINSKIWVSPATGGSLQKLAESQGMGVE